MDFKDLQLLVSNRKKACDIFLNRNKERILDYINASQNDKGTKSIVLNYIDVENPIGKNELIELLYLYLDDFLMEWELEYVFNHLDGCDIDDEKIEEIVFNFANPYLNFYISKENINRTISYLKRETLNLQLESVDIRLKQKEEGYRPNYKSKVQSFLK